MSEKTIDDIIISRLDKLFQASDAGNGQLVDEIVGQILLFLKRKPKVHDEIIKYKAKLEEALEDEITSLEKEAEQCRNEISRQSFIRGEQASLDWEHRSLMIEKIIEELRKQKILRFDNDEEGTITKTAK